MDELRQRIGELGLAHTLGDDEAIGIINGALESGDLEQAKDTIKGVLKDLEAVSLGGFPIGVELDLVELVGYDF